MSNPDHTRRKAGIIARGVDANGDDRNLLVNSDGSLASSGALGTSTAHSAAYEASRVLKASAGTLLLLYGYNSGPAQFLQLHDAESLPADAAVPVATFAIAATSNFSLAIPITGQPFATGIVVTNSSTGPAKTIGASDCWFTAVVK